MDQSNETTVLLRANKQNERQGAKEISQRFLEIDIE